MIITSSVDRWYPSQHTDSASTAKLQPGQLVIADRRPFRVTRISEIPAEKWPEKYVDAWRDAGMPEEWRRRPLHIHGRWEDSQDTREYTATGPADHRWDVLPEHYSVCRLCQEIPPCRHVHNERILDHAAECMEEAMAILPGACHGCREPISSRQKSFTFPGPNLVRPDLGDNTAVFHTRRACLAAVKSYDKEWAAAEPGRSQFFYCDGLQINHWNGTSECTQPDCVAKGEMEVLVSHKARLWHRPGAQARHFDLMRDLGNVDPGVGHESCWCIQ